MRVVVTCVLVAATLVLGACATVEPVASHAFQVRDGVTGRTLWSGAVSYTVRTARVGATERVVALPGLGELQVGVGSDDGACRLVWSVGELGGLVIYNAERTPCGTFDGGRICLTAARFLAPAGPSIPRGEAPVSVVVQGCADANDLLWGKVVGPETASVGPRVWRERCVPIPHRRGCEPTYLGRREAFVDTNPGARESIGFRYDGEQWYACFLEADAGAYLLHIHIEDSCGRAERLRLAGHSADLDD